MSDRREAAQLREIDVALRPLREYAKLLRGEDFKVIAIELEKLVRQASAALKGVGAISQTPPPRAEGAAQRPYMSLMIDSELKVLGAEGGAPTSPRQKFYCAECQMSVPVDEDGCCRMCGRDATVGGAAPTSPPLDALIAKCRAKADRMEADGQDMARDAGAGVVHPAEWEASRLRDYADELARLAASPASATPPRDK